ncbi:MAG: dethiobiotin synthase [Bacteroidetes bacterium]|nr:dethiobiotin synthase [Bacteroidota bacterium]
MSTKLFVTGIGTDVGKTLVSKILCRVWSADYWKPMQSGELHALDSQKVASIQGENFQAFPEQFLLSKPLSPHAAAEIDGITLKVTDFKLPETDRNLILEGAGGLLVPINSDGDTILTLIEQLNIPVVLVSRHYLGSINHTLLSVSALKQQKIPIVGIIFVGNPLPGTEEIICKYTQLPVIAKIPLLDPFTDGTIESYCETYGEEIKLNLNHELERIR